MTKDAMRSAAIAAIDRMLERPDAVGHMNAHLAAERSRLERLLAAETAGELTFLRTGDLAHTERNWPCVSPDTLWALIVRGSDIEAGSVRAGYRARHPDLASRINAIT